MPFPLDALVIPAGVQSIDVTKFQKRYPEFVIGLADGRLALVGYREKVVSRYIDMKETITSMLVAKRELGLKSIECPAPTITFTYDTIVATLPALHIFNIRFERIFLINLTPIISDQLPNGHGAFLSMHSTSTVPSAGTQSTMSIIYMTSLGVLGELLYSIPEPDADEYYAYDEDKPVPELPSHLLTPPYPIIHSHASTVVGATPHSQVMTTAVTSIILIIEYHYQVQELFTVGLDKTLRMWDLENQVIIIIDIIIAIIIIIVTTIIIVIIITNHY